MNGRCENDPIDRANDVCQMCAGEFCPACIIYPHGQKKPGVCKECAIAGSGLRGSSASAKRMSSRQVKKRRQDLADLAVEAGDQKFQFFDEDETFELKGPLVGPEFDEPEEPKRRRVPKMKRTKTDEVPQHSSEMPPAPMAPNDDSGLDVDTEEDDAIDIAATLDALTPRTQTPAPVPKGPSATELLEKLKEVKGPDAVPAFSEPTSESPVADPWVPAGKDPWVPAERSVDRFEAPAPAPTVHEPTAPAPTFHEPAFHQPAFHDDDPFAATAPTPSHRRAEDPPAPAPVASAAPTEVAAAPDNLDLSMNPFATDEPAPVGASTQSTKADTDSSGNWVPPILRGMAPVDERDPNLPRRR